MKMTVGLIYGGKSGEHEVSLQSAASVLKNLDPAQYEVTLVGITKEGRWYAQEPPGPVDTIGQALEITEDEGRLVAAVPARGLVVGRAPLEIDIAFPVLHGPFGEDGTVQGLLEVAGVPYVGADVLGSALGMDKELSKRLWQAQGLPTVPYISVDARELALTGSAGARPAKDERVGELLEKVSEHFALPLFVKPARVGSSVGISRVRTAEEFGPALAEALRFDTKALIEPGISGQEVECSVFGAREIEVSTPGEIVSRDGFYSYEAKYVDPDGAELIVPARLSQDLTERVRTLARKAYVALGIEGMARVDFFVGPDETIYLNEINTIPGFTRISMFPRLFAHDGLPYAALLDRLIDLARTRFDTKQALETSYV